jgi:hypothetical protein
MIYADECFVSFFYSNRSFLYILKVIMYQFMYDTNVLKSVFNVFICSDGTVNVYNNKSLWKLYNYFKKKIMWKMK